MTMKIGLNKTAMQSLGLGLFTRVTRAVPEQGTWQTTLQARDLSGDGKPDAYYDTELDITWLRDANANGMMNWQTANAWAAGLDVHGVRGWRLPMMIDDDALKFDFGYADTDCGYNSRTKNGDTVYSEMAHLFYVTLGNHGFYDTTGSPHPNRLVGVTNSGPFRHMQAFMCWTGREYAPWTGFGWFFGNDFGFQCFADQHYELFAMAVHPGDVGRPQ
jgi:hypothetical protein